MDEWRSRNSEYDEIRENTPSWDITDFCFGNFHRISLLTIMLYNGNFSNPNYIESYVGKLLVSGNGQATSYRFRQKRWKTSSIAAAENW